MLCMTWFNRSKSGWKLFVLTAGPLSPLFPLRPAGPGRPCIIERIQQTWLDIQVIEFIQILHKLTKFLQSVWTYYACRFTVAQSIEDEC